MSNRVGVDGSTFLLVDATQIADFYEFVTSITRMKVSAYSKMSTTIYGPSKYLTDSFSSSQFGVWGVI